MGLYRLAFTLAALALGAGGALAQDASPPGDSAAAPPPPSLAEHAAQRFPQPVRVGDLIGRRVLKPAEDQPVLGRVAAIARRGDGGLDVVIRSGGVLGVGTRPVAAPIEAIALLGEHVALVDVTPEQLASLPTLDLSSVSPLPPDAIIQVGIVGPFH